MASRGGSFRFRLSTAPRHGTTRPIRPRASAWAVCLLVGAAWLTSAWPGGVASATPLSRPEVVKLVKKKVQEGRLFTVVRELGIDFKVTPEIADELRAAGASAALIAALQALASGEEPKAPSPAPPPGVAAPAVPAPAAPPAAPSAPAPTPPAALMTPAPAAAPPVVAAPATPTVVHAPAPARTPVPSAPAPGAATAEPESAEEKEEARPPHPLEPPPAAALPKGAAETMAALIPGPPPPPPPPVISALRAPVAAEPPVAPLRAPVAVAPTPAAPVTPEPAAEAPNRWEVVRPLLEKASSLASEGDVRGAQTLVVRAMEIDPGEPQVWKAFKGIEQDLLARAETFLADGQLQRAFREFQFVVTTNPDSALGFNGVGLALLSLKNYDEAVAAFEKALALDPANARYRQALTRARSLQRASKALERQGQQNLKEMIEDQSGRKKGP